MNKLCYIFNTETQSYQLKSVPSHINVIYKNIQETSYTCKQNQTKKHIKSYLSTNSTNSWVDSLYSEYYSDTE